MTSTQEQYIALKVKRSRICLDVHGLENVINEMHLIDEQINVLRSCMTLDEICEGNRMSRPARRENYKAVLATFGN